VPKLPVVSGKQAVEAFSKRGWKPDRRKGSHIVLTKEGSPVILSVPDHKEIQRGTLRSLIRDAGLTLKAFINLLRVRWALVYYLFNPADLAAFQPDLDAMGVNCRVCQNILDYPFSCFPGPLVSLHDY